MTATPRGCALALAVLIAALAMSTASADAQRPRSDAPSALDQPVSWLAHQIESLVEGNDSRGTPAARAVHPVGGGVNYGEAAARFGAARSGHVHEGQDVFAPAGTPLLAVRDAVVVETGNDGGRGNYVALYSRSVRQTYVYLHMQAPSVLGVGARVRAGGRVGALGCTGSCWGDHLHFEIRPGRGTGGRPIDPLPQLRRWRSARP